MSKRSMSPAAIWGRILREWIAAAMIGLGLSNVVFGPHRQAGIVIAVAGALIGVVQLIARWQHRRQR